MPVLVRAELDRWMGFARLRFPFDRATIERIKDVPGARWDPNNKCWWVSIHGWEILKSVGLRGSETEISLGLPNTITAAIPDQIGSKLRPYQNDAAKFLLCNSGAMLTMEMRTGKALRWSSKALTPGGWVVMKDLAVGDHVVDPDTGEGVPVEGVYPQGVRKLYRVTFSDGAFVDADEEHLWLLETPNTRYRGTEPKLLTTWEIIASGLRWKDYSEEENRGDGNRKWFVPLTQPVHFGPVPGERPLDPWLLGALLANGYFGEMLSISKTDPEFIERVRHSLPVDLVQKDEVTWRFRPQRELRAALETLRLIGHRAWEKFIPRQYLYALPEMRLELLRGLMDGDGDCSLGSNGKQSFVSFNTISPALRDGLVWLVRSLGGYASIYEYPELTYTYEGLEKIGRPSWRLHINLPVNPFSITAKAERWRPVRLARAIESIEPIGEDEAICIRVASKRSLFIADDFVVTHNTPSAIGALTAAMGAGAIDAAFIAYPASVRETWRSQLRDWAGLELTALESFTELTDAEVAAARAKPWLVLGCHYEILSQREEDIHKILTGKSYVSISDELHHCKNRKAPRTRALKRVGSAWGSTVISNATSVADDDNARQVASGYCIARWGLTGTPMRNRNKDLFCLFDWIHPGGMGGYWSFAKKYADAHINDRGHWEDKGNTNSDELNKRLAAVSFKVTRAQVAPWLPKSDRKVIMCGMPLPLMKKYRALEKAYAVKVAATLDEGFGGSEESLKELALATVSAKIPTAVDRAYDHASRGAKVVCFANYHETLQKLDESFDAFVEADKAANADGQSLYPPHFCAGGWMTPAKRHAVIEQWRACPGPSILLANTISSGVGIDLADAEAAIFVELTWVPADYRQAEDRIQDVHKGKRVTPPLYEMLVVRDTIDEAMAAKLLEKIRNIEDVVGADGESANLAGALRESGVVSNNRLGLPNTSHETVMAAIASIRDRWLSDRSDDQTEGEKLRDKLLAAASSLEDEDPEADSAEAL